MTRGIKVWVTEVGLSWVCYDCCSSIVKTGVCQRTIDREHDVQSVTWMPSGDAFITVEGTSVHKMVRQRFKMNIWAGVKLILSFLVKNLTGHVEWSHDFTRLSLHDVVVTPDEHRWSPWIPSCTV